MTLRWRGPLDRPGVRALLAALPAAGVEVCVRHLGRAELLEMDPAARTLLFPHAAWGAPVPALGVTDLAGGVAPGRGRAAAEVVWLPERPGPDLMGGASGAAEVWARDAAGMDAARSWGVPEERLALVPEPLGTDSPLPRGRPVRLVRVTGARQAVEAVASWVAGPRDPDAVLVIAAERPGLELGAAIVAATPDPDALPDIVVLEEPPADPRALDPDAVAPPAAESAALAAARLAALTPPAPAPRRASDRRPLLAISGAISAASSLAQLTRDLARAILLRDDVELALIDRRPGPLAEDPEVAALLDRAPAPTRPPDLLVRNDHPPRFPGDAVATASFLHWEFGPPPREWVESAGIGGEEVWVPSDASGAGFVAAGIPADRVVTVPLGVDPVRFRPDGPALDLADRAPGVRLLFVGGLVHRKGVDLLLDAWERAFGEDDQVTLVVKRFGGGGPYPAGDLDRRVERMAGLRAGPRVLLLDGPMTEAQMAALYRACDCLVHPYRGEAFGMTMIEAMACGLPVIAPEHGSARAFMDHDTALLLPAVRRELPTLVDGDGRVLCGPPVVHEVDVDQLASGMRRVVADPSRAREVGRRAAAHIRAHHGWDRAASVAAGRAALHAGASR